MNEFEWRRHLRELRQPVAPRTDLWQRIDAALDVSARTTPVAAPAAARRFRHGPLAVGMAAVLLLAGGIGWRLHRSAAPTAAARIIAAAAPWKPSDPRLAGAAIELDAAQLELRLALRQAPASPSLRRLLARTERQQASLRQFERQAS